MNQNALVVQGLAKTYDGFVLKDVSFRVPSGAIVGLIGENGAGKTTTLHAILGLIDRDAGDIEILGERDAPMRDSLRGQIGVVWPRFPFSCLRRPGCSRAGVWRIPA